MKKQKKKTLIGNKKNNKYLKSIIHINSEEPLNTNNNNKNTNINNNNNNNNHNNLLVNNYLSVNSNQKLLFPTQTNILNQTIFNKTLKNQFDTKLFTEDIPNINNYTPFYKQIKTILYIIIESSIENIIIIAINILSILFYDIMILFFKYKDKKFYLSFYYFCILIFLIDFIVKKIFIHHIINTVHFWLNLISLILFFIDFDKITYYLFGKIMYNINDLNDLNYNEQFYIEIILNSFQILKILRILNVYKIINEMQKDSKIKFFAKKYTEKKKINKINKIHKSQKKLITISNNNLNTSILPNSNNNNATTVVNQLNNTINLNNISNTNFLNNDKKTITTKVNEMYSDMNKINSKLQEKQIYKYIKKNKLLKENLVSKKIEKSLIYITIVILLTCYSISYNTHINYNESHLSYEVLCKRINGYYEQNQNLDLNHNNFINFLNKISSNHNLKNYPIISIKYNDTILYKNIKLSNKFLNNYYHRKDFSYVFSKPFNNKTLIHVLKIRINRFESILNIVRFIVIITIFFIYIITTKQDIDELIFVPLKKIVKIIDLISKDPVNGKTLNSIKNLRNNSKEFLNFENEIKIIENVIIRVSELMAISFGEAGGEVIKKNISCSEGLNPMIKGSKIKAIFGFCYIHHFSIINEVFQDKTNVFVNTISEIVHSSVDKFNGINNKNLGDCFLLTWKFKDSKESNNINNNNNNDNNNPNNISINHVNKNASSNYVINISNMKNDINESIYLSDSNNITKINEKADSALLAFLNIIKKINKSKEILVYRKDPLLIQKFGKNFSVQMGFGLHAGWGIEGAIGSLYKIDCSYLSPNVNLAARLETATNIYKVDILLSGDFYELLSDYMKNYCRKIDIVTVKGSNKPIKLYTIDLNKNIKKGKMISKKDHMSFREKRNYYSFKKKKLWNLYNKQNLFLSIGEIYIKKSKGMRTLLKNKKSKKFYDYFNKGFEHYIDGDWNKAYNNLIKAKFLDKNDGPTNTIINFLKNYDLKKPPNWKGYRELTSKI